MSDNFVSEITLECLMNREQYAKYINIKSLITVNSGSSANLVAFATLTAKELGEEAIKPGDEVIMPSYTFVSTANAFILRGAKIVFIDSTADNPNIDAKLILVPN